MLDAEREANRENRRIITALTQRIPALEASPEPSESPLTDADESERVDSPPEYPTKRPRPETEGIQTGRGVERMVGASALLAKLCSPLLQRKA